MIANLSLLLASSAMVMAQAIEKDVGRPFGSNKQLNVAPGCNDFSTSDHENVYLVPDSGVYQFEFGKTGTFAYQSFISDLPYLSFIEVWDCFCSGDEFVVYVDGRKAFETHGDSDDECNFWSNDPTYCLVNSGYGNSLNYGYTWLLPGPHNISIGVRNSPYGAGSAFLNLASVCQFGQEIGQCCWPTDIFPWDGSNGVGWCNYRTIHSQCNSCPQVWNENHRQGCGGHHGGCHRHHHHHHHHKGAAEKEAATNEQQ